MEAIARRLRLSSAAVQGIATFYAQFRFRPPGRHRVTVCRGTACHVRGSAGLVDGLAECLHVRPQGTTADRAFALETVACFGSCALAPVVMVDGKVFGRRTPAAARRMLGRLRRAGASRSRRGGAREKP
jgi:NADH-quinone oxidoreductase subunit E